MIRSFFHARLLNVFRGGNITPPRFLHTNRGCMSIEKPASLFFVVIGSSITGLVFGSDLVRWIMAAALAVVAVPLWLNVRRALLQQFWRDVERVIVASDEQRSKEQLSALE